MNVPLTTSRRLRHLALILMWGVATGAAAAEPERTGERYAFLVGVQTYVRPDLRPLRFSDNDIETLAGVLEERGYPGENLLTLSQSRVTRDVRYTPFRENILTELRLFARLMQPEDSLVVALAGHGLQFRGDEAVYFCPCDADITRTETLIGIEELYELLRTECQARDIVLLIDACRNDPLSNNARSRAEVDLETTTRPQQIAVPRGMASFFSCSPGEQAFEHPSLKHGVFFHHVIEGIRGAADLDSNGEVTLTELHASITGKVQRYSFREFRAAQTPQLSGKVSGVFSVSIMPEEPVPADSEDSELAAAIPDDLPPGLATDLPPADDEQNTAPADSEQLATATPIGRGSSINGAGAVPSAPLDVPTAGQPAVAGPARPPSAAGTIPVAALRFRSPGKFLTYLQDAERLLDRSVIGRLSGPLAALERHLDDRSVSALFLDASSDSSELLLSGILRLRDPGNFRAALESVPAVAETGVHQLSHNGEPIYLREQDGWLLFSAGRISETQITLQDDPAAYVGDLTGESDTQLSLFTQNIPAERRDDVQRAVLRHLIQRLVGNSDSVSRRLRHDREALARLSRMARLLTEQGGRIDVVSRIDEEYGSVKHHVNIQAVPRTQLAAALDSPPTGKPAPRTCVPVRDCDGGECRVIRRHGCH